jgi:hypothetical protein
MVSQKEKIARERVLQENSFLYEQGAGHEPYFTLTPAGAKALKNYLAEKKIEFEAVGGDCGYDVGVPAEVLRNFLAETMEIKLRSSSKIGSETEAISVLLGAASRGFTRSAGTPEEGKVALDPWALDVLAKSKSRAGSI